MRGSEFALQQGRVMQVVWDHLIFYQKFFVSAWANMTPMQYGFLLVSIAVTGWALMKSGAAQ